MSGEELRNLLLEGSKRFGVDLSDSKLDQFHLYLENLAKWNKRINLTAIKDERDIVISHFIDSISAIPFIIDGNKVLDIGSGGGFPGIPLKIVRPELNITLLDSVSKKVSFMNDTIRKLALHDIEAVWGRAEDLNNKVPRESFDYVITRALGSIEETSMLSLPYLSRSGTIILMRGRKGASEFASIRDDLLKRFQLTDIIEFTLPFCEHERAVIVLKPKVKKA